MPKEPRSWDAIMADIRDVDARISACRRENANCLIVMAVFIAGAFIVLLTLGVF